MSEKGSGNEQPPEEPIIKYKIQTPEFDSTYVVLEIIIETEKMSKIIIEDVEYADRYFLIRYNLDEDPKSEKIKNYYTII